MRTRSVPAGLRGNQNKKNKGMSMVEVMVGFVILIGILGGLSGSIAFSHRMYLRSVDMKRAQQVVMQNIYKKDVLSGRTAEDTGLELKVLESVNPTTGLASLVPAKLKDGTQVKLNISSYHISSADLTGATETELDMNYYIFDH